MKKLVIFFILAIAGISTTVAQDIITLKTGEEMKARIIRLNPKDVAFIPANSTDTAFLLREDVTKLQYHSGIIILLTEAEKPGFSIGPETDSLYTMGKNDALLYYKGYTGAAVGTLVTSIFFPWGLIPAIACSAKPPAMENLGYNNRQLMEHPGYYNGYVSEAHKIKKKKVWGGFAIGSGLFFAFALLVNVVN